MPRLPLTIWMNMPSPYQGDFFAELAARADVDLQVVFAGKMETERSTLGWRPPAATYPVRFLSPGFLGVMQGSWLAWRQRHRVQVVNGVWARAPFLAAAGWLLLLGAPVFFHAEASDPRLARSHRRLALRTWLGRWMLRRARGVFAISGIAERFYAGLGAERRTLFPFGYFKRHRFESGIRTVPNRPEVLFVGQLVERKGVDLLLNAFAELATEFPTTILAFVGAGEMEAALKAQASRASWGNRVRFEGVLSSDAIDARIAQADVLVLPSRFDGWGLVVNEALAVGVPVIVSSACGAADLIDAPEDGRVVPAGDQAALTSTLRAMLLASPEYRPDPWNWSAKIGISPAVDYFLGCLRYGLHRQPGKPKPPWRKQSSTDAAAETQTD